MICIRIIVPVAATVVLGGSLLTLSGAADNTVPGGAQARNDTAVTAKVKALLLRDQRIRGLDIQVETQQGLVRLGGFTRNALEKQLAAEIARSVDGVREIRNDIRIK
jgi:hyperosmotically inducible protein